MNSEESTLNILPEGCDKSTSWAYLYVGGDDSALAKLYDLSTTSWDYSKWAPCGQVTDNIDGVITHYCCPSCQPAKA